MNRGVFALLLCLLLSACGKSDQQKAVAFARACHDAQFTPSQCLFLWDMAKQTAAADDDATVAAIMAGVAHVSAAAAAQH